jgi:DNA-binding GntR family transcriptional regulator
MAALKRRDAAGAAALSEQHFRQGLAAAVPAPPASTRPRAPKRRAA